MSFSFLSQSSLLHRLLLSVLVLGSTSCAPCIASTTSPPRVVEVNPASLATLPGNLQRCIRDFVPGLLRAASGFLVLNGHALHVQRNPETLERALKVGDLVVWRDSYVVNADLQRKDRVEKMQVLLSDDIVLDHYVVPGDILAEIFRLNGNRLISGPSELPVWLSGVVVGIEGGGRPPSQSGAEDEQGLPGEQPAHAILENVRWAEQGHPQAASLVYEFSESECRHDVRNGLLTELRLMLSRGQGDGLADPYLVSDEQLRLTAWSFSEVLEVLAFTATMAKRVLESSWLVSSVWENDKSLGEDGWRKLVDALQVFTVDSSVADADNLRMNSAQQHTRASFFDDQQSTENQGSWIASNLGRDTLDVHKFAVCYWKRIMLKIEPEEELRHRDLKLLGTKIDAEGWYRAGVKVSGK